MKMEISMITVNNKLNRLILISAIATVLTLDVTAQDNDIDRIYVDKTEFGKMTVNGLTLIQLNQPGKSFEILNNLGEPLNKKYHKKFAYETWILTYQGLKLIYVNPNGEPVLQEMIIHEFDEGMGVNIGSLKVSPETKQGDLKTSINGRMDIKTYSVPNDAKESEKYQKGHSYMEFSFDKSDGKIKKIIYRDKVI